MSELKITTHTTYTYETSDGREFDNEAEALEWQKILETFNSISMLDHQFKPTLIPSAVYYLHIKNQEQLKAFDAVQEYDGYGAVPKELGHFCYDEISDEFIQIEDKVAQLLDIVRVLDSRDRKD